MKLFRKKPDTFDYQLARVCLTCKKDFSGRYCPACGEKVVEPDDRSFAHFLSGLLNAFTFFETKGYKSLRALIFNPGQLSADITLGIRQPYMKPVPFFFLANFIYFLFPLFQTFNTNLLQQMRSAPPYNAWVNEMVQAHLTTTGQSLESLSAVYNPSSTGWSKLLLILLVIYIFPFIALVNYAKKNYLSDQLMFSMEFITYVLYVPTILLSTMLAVIVLAGKLVNLDLNFIFQDTYTGPFILMTLFYFLIRGIRNFYQFPWWRSILNAVLLVASMAVVLNAYRFTLFLVTFNSL